MSAALVSCAGGSASEMTLAMTGVDCSVPVGAKKHMKAAKRVVSQCLNILKLLWIDY